MSIYLFCIQNKNRHGVLPTSSFIYNLSRAVFHLKSESMQDNYFYELNDSVMTHLSNFMTYGFVDIYVQSIHPRNSS